MLSPASARTTWQGYTFTRRTARALTWVQARANVGVLQVAQGGFNKGGVSQSSGTHDLDAVDLRTKHLTPHQKTSLLRKMRQAGFAAWLRPVNWDGANGGEHLHAIPAGYPKDVSGGAASQVLAYDAGRDGLRSNRMDVYPYRPIPRVRFSWLQNKPVPR